jgi:anthranilate phosphoribosyltransferase
LVDRRHLTRQESAAAMNAIMSGLVSESLIAAFLVALRMKGETVEEITGCAEAMRSKASRVPASTERLIDTCGTGGDHTGTFNISTAAAVVAAAAGARVAKHGNRAVSSRSGSADALRALGVNIDISPQKAGAVLERVGITFIFAPTVHPAMKYAIGVRKDLSMRSVFNVLGPLTNPAGVRRQVLGVYDPALTEPLASVLGALGAEHAWVVHGAGGMDECSLAGPTRVSEWKDGSVHTTELRPSDAGLSEARLEELHGGDAQANAAIIRQILDGHRGAKTDATLFNAGAALVVAGVESNLRSGVERAREAVQSGMARRLLQQWIEATRSMT